MNIDKGSKVSTSKSNSIKKKKEVEKSGVNSKSNTVTGEKPFKKKNHDMTGQSDRQQSNPAQLSKVLQIPATKSKTHKTSSSKDPSINNPKSKVQVNQTLKQPRKKVVSEDPSVATQKKKTHKTEDRKASVRDPEASRSVETQKASGSKVPSKVVRKKNKKKNPSPSGYRPHSCTPVHHIRWEGNDKELCGYKCELCENDLSCSPQEDDYGYHEDDEYYDEYDEYQTRSESQILLPAVDILSCGHAFHSECARNLIPDEESTDPLCVLCFSMV